MSKVESVESLKPVESKKRKREGRGAFIVLEGLDRSGKSTQCRLLTDYLNLSGHPSVSMRFPDRTTTIGKMIDGYLKSSLEAEDHAIHLLFVANRWEKNSEMRAALEEGKTVIVDRYSYSGTAFTSAKGIDPTWCYSPEVGLLEPDLVIYLDVAIQQAEKRGEFGAERYEAKEMQITVGKIFQKLKEDFWKTVDASSTIEKIQDEVRELAVQAITKSAQAPLKTIEARKIGDPGRGKNNTNNPVKVIGRFE